jgi:hypothetical protein
MDLKYIGLEAVGWIYLSCKRCKCLAYVNMGMNLQDL